MQHSYLGEPHHAAQVVVETTGGAPFAAEFVIDYSDSSGIQTMPDPTYPVRIMGTARLKDGLIVGGVCHQFRQEGEGFRAKLSIAVEFSNWIEAANCS